MKKGLLKKILAVSLVLTLGSSIVACGSKDDSASNGKKRTLKIITWSNQASIDALKELSDKYMEKYKDVTVEVQSVDTNNYANLQKTRLQANDVDIVSLDGASFKGEKVDWAPGPAPQWQQLVDAGSFVDLTNEPWIKNWSTGAKAGTYNGKVYGISTGAVANTGVFYNKAIFEKYGLEVPKTWDEFVEVCNTLKKNNVVPMTSGGGDVWPYTMLGNNVAAGILDDYEAFAKGLWTGETKYNDETSMKIFERLEFINQNMEKNFMGIPYSSIISRFVGEKAAMLPDGSWQAAEITKADPDFKFGYFPLPGDKEGVSLNGKFDLYMAVNAKSKNKDDAMKWMEMLSDKDNYTDFVNTTGFIPTMDDVDVKNEFIKEILPATANLQPALEQFVRTPAGAGQYVGFNTQYLKSAGGEIGTIKELADLAQKDLEDGIKANTGK